MKKILCLTVALLIGTNVLAGSYIDRQLKEAKKNTKYNTVKTQLKDSSYADLYIQKQDIKNIKDPKLIKLSNFEPIDEKLYQNKLAQDEKVYEKEIIPALRKKTKTVNVEPLEVDFYKVYRIAERLIRANNLEHQNWRITIRKTQDFNAFAADTNLVTINTGLYDTLYTNEDALAFIIAHEMSHNLFGHQQRKLEMWRYYQAWKRPAKKAAISPVVAASVKLATSSGALYYKTHMYKEYRMMEYLADSEGMNMLIKAGYSPSEALYALKFMDSMSDLWMLISRTHPMTEDRIKSANETIYFASPEWVDEGKYNIFHSNVLPVKKSSDHVSIVISKDDTAENFYSPETYDERLTRLAYVSYKKGDMQNAIKYFEKLLNVKNDYVTNLYLSYANEYLYNQTHDDKYKKSAVKYAQTAKQLNKTDKNVIEQCESL